MICLIWKKYAALLHANLKTLRLLGSSWLNRSLKFLKWPGEPCGVQFLELREGLVEASSLRHILTRFKSLRTLIIHPTDGRRYDDEGQWDFNLDEFGAILRELGQDLVELSLHNNNFRNYPVGTGEYEGYLGSLVELRSPRHLNVVIEHLVDDIRPTLADVFPPSLETLHLHHDGKYKRNEVLYRHHCGFVNSAVRKLLEQGRMPNLRQVSMERGYKKTLEGEFDGKVAGWDMTVKNVDMWLKHGTLGCRRTMVTFTRRFER
ncbi:hypothetical protein LA080_001930 [Diaporthe eres]|nr:hypothetical protein LA080_001930 [Diaporthe eres]